MGAATYTHGVQATPRRRASSSAAVASTSASASGRMPLVRDEGVYDRYGCIIPEEIIQEFLDWREKTLLDNQRKRDEYANIISSLSEPYTDFKLRRLFWSGLPPESRRGLWLQVTGVGSTLRANAGRYAELLSAANERDEQRETNSARASIGADILRTFGRNCRIREERMDEKLKNVLTAYARYNRFIGYAQSMNVVTSAFLLLDFSEEEAFWMLNHVVCNLLPDVYDREVLGVVADCEVLEYYVRAKLPHLHAFMLRNDFGVGDFWPSMLMCMYVGHVPYETLYRLWDRVMYGGALELFRAALKFLAYVERKVTATDGADLDVIRAVLKSAHMELVDPALALSVMPGRQKMESGQLHMRRMRTRERIRVTKERAVAAATTTITVASPPPPPRQTPFVQHSASHTNAVNTMSTHVVSSSSSTPQNESPSLALRKAASLNRVSASVTAALAAAALASTPTVAHVNGSLRAVTPSPTGTVEELRPAAAAATASSSRQHDTLSQSYDESDDDDASNNNNDSKRFSLTERKFESKPRPKNSKVPLAESSSAVRVVDTGTIRDLSGMDIDSDDDEDAGGSNSAEAENSQ